MMPVYFVQAGEGGPIKIGFAKDVARRLGKLRVDCPHPILLLGFIPEGTEADEGAMHRRFSADRLRGEWFNPTQAIIELTATLPTVALSSEGRARERVPRWRYRERPSDRSWRIEVIGETRHPIIRRTLCPPMPGVGARGPTPNFLPLSEAEFAEDALLRIRADDPSEWPTWWFDWLRARGSTDTRINQFYHLKLPTRPHGIDLIGGKTGVDEPVWQQPSWWAAIWPPARAFLASVHSA